MQAAFLGALVIQGGHRSNAARAAKVSRSQTYVWQEDPIFAAQFERASKQAFGVLEDAMIDRAKNGVKKGIYYQGDKVATELVYSDGLMMMLARAGDPKYRTSTVESTGKDGGPIESKIEVVFVRPKE